MARQAAPVVLPKPNPQMVKTRSEGLTLISPLKPLVGRLQVLTEEDYGVADAILARVRTARMVWASKLDPIRKPLKEAEASLKASLNGIKQLDAEVDDPLSEMEEDIKTKMKTYKLEEAQRIEDERRRKLLEASRLDEQAKAKEEAAAKATTSQMRARLEQARADLTANAQLVETQANNLEGVKAANSTSRTVKKIRIADPLKFVQALKSYMPRAGIYQMEVPPLQLLTMHTTLDGRMVPEGSAHEKLEVELAKLWATQPGVVESWPGIETFDDIVIAKR